MSKYFKTDFLFEFLNKYNYNKFNSYDNSFGVGP